MGFSLSLVLVSLHSISTPGKNYFQLRGAGCVSFQSNLNDPADSLAKSRIYFPSVHTPFSHLECMQDRSYGARPEGVSVPVPHPPISGQEQMSVEENRNG